MASPAEHVPNTTSIIASALEALARGESEDLAAYLREVEVRAPLDNCRAICHCYAVTLDGNGRPRVDALIRAICHRVIDYAIPRSAIQAATEQEQRTGSTAAKARLYEEAEALFTSLEKTGEGGELLLFCLAEAILGLPQLLCKMDLKTDPQVHFHGSDGLHAGVDEETGKLLLYWGESKIYHDPQRAIYDCLKSLSGYLLAEGEERRDIQLLGRYLDLNHPALERALKNYLNPDSPAFLSVEYSGLCLVGFDCDAYPGAPNQKTLDLLTGEVAQLVPVWKEYIGKRLGDEKLDSFHMHFFCVPFPSANDFRKEFRKRLGFVDDD
jgi:hypothetical protein